MLVNLLLVANDYLKTVPRFDQSNSIKKNIHINRSQTKKPIRSINDDYFIECSTTGIYMSSVYIDSSCLSLSNVAANTSFKHKAKRLSYYEHEEIVFWFEVPALAPIE